MGVGLTFVNRNLMGRETRWPRGFAGISIANARELNRRDRRGIAVNPALA